MQHLKDKIHSITLERTMCYGPCPVYRVTFNKDGKAIYEGRNNVDKIGRYVGEVDLSDFEKMSELLERLKFGELNSDYSADKENSELQTVITSVSYNQGEKCVSNHGDSGPMEIWAVEKVVDGIVQDIYWEEEEGTAL